MNIPTKPVTVLTRLAQVLAVGALLSWPSPVRAQESDLVEALSGKAHPLSLKLKDMNTDWRRVTVQGSSIVRDNVSVNVNGSTAGSTSQNNILGAVTSNRAYLTKGQVIAAGGRSYLVAYRLPGSGLDLGMLLQMMATKKPPASTTLTPESTVPLSLLDIATIGSLDEVRSFDMQTEIAESENVLRTITELMKSQGGGSSTNQPPPPKAESSK